MNGQMRYAQTGAETVVGDLTCATDIARLCWLPPPLLRHQCVGALFGNDRYRGGRGTRARRSGGIRQLSQMTVSPLRKQVHAFSHDREIIFVTLGTFVG
jgi:hypothetical protein